MLSAAEKNRKIDHGAEIVFVLCLIGYTVLMYRLFYLQALHCGIRDSYVSDIKAYLQTIMGLESGYDFPYPVYFAFGKFFLLFTNVAVAGALAAALLNSLGVVILYYYMQKALREYAKGTVFENYGGLIAVLLSFSMFFVSMLYLPGGMYLPGLGRKYLGTFTPNPYHNITYMATRPFATLAFFQFVRIVDYYEEKTDVKEFCLFGLSLLLTTMTKPSYTLVLVSTAGLLMLYRLFRSKWKTFKRAFYLGLAFVPTFIDLLYQFGGVFGRHSLAGEEGGIGFGLASVWKIYTGNIPFSMALAMGFPLLVLVLHMGELKKNTLYRFSWAQLIVSAGEFFLLYEKGRRFADANFSWGYMHGLFFVFVASLLVLAEDMMKKRGKAGILVLCLQWLAFGGHLLCGAVYFLYVWGGNPYHLF